MTVILTKEVDEGVPVWSVNVDGTSVGDVAKPDTPYEATRYGSRVASAEFPTLQAAVDWITEKAAQRPH